MQNYAIYAYAAMNPTIHIIVCFPSCLNDGTILMLSIDCIFPSSQPDNWDLTGIFAFAVAYGLYLMLSM